MTPVPVIMKLTRTSLTACASLMSLLYFSYATGTRSIKEESKIPKMATKSANPDSPAVLRNIRDRTIKKGS